MKFDIDSLNYNPLVEQIVQILKTKTQQNTDNFFRLQTNFYLSLVASLMNVKINSPITGKIPINFYGINLATSGSGKGFSSNILENEILKDFRERFLNELFPVKAELELDLEANRRHKVLGISPQEALDKLQKELRSYGAIRFTNSEATTPAIKQYRNLLLLAKLGSVNLIVDECYTPDMEVMTNEGWIRFDQLTNDMLVGQFDTSTEEITFVKPIRYIKKYYQGEIYNFNSGRAIDMSVTPNHLMTMYHQRGEYIKVKPNEVNTSHRFPLVGKGKINNLHKMTNKLRLALAIQADGTLRKNGVEIGLSKPRKIVELLNIFKALNLSPNSWVDSQNKTFWYISHKDLLDIKVSKNLYDILPNITEVDYIFAREVLTEIVKWDGSIDKTRPNIYRFTCKYKHNVDLVNQYAVLAGYRTHTVYNPKAGYTGGWYVTWNKTGISKAQLSTLNSSTNPLRTTSYYDGYVYCIEVPTGSFMLRRNGYVMVGGNCGYNISKIEDALHTMLELYDKGYVKEKLTKNTETSSRYKELIGSTPANLLMFGTPSKLLDGSKTENDFFTLLDTGYARRSFFAYSKKSNNETELTPDELYDLITRPNQAQEIIDLQYKFSKLADINVANLELQVPRQTGVHLLAYRQWCQERAKQLPEFAEIQKAELEHRYFKALKLAGTYCFLDLESEIRIEHLNQAIKFTEDSGKAIEQIFTREKPYERLAKYIASTGDTELTQVDIQNDLPFYKGSQAHKTELMNMAIAWGYKNNIIIRKSFKDGIEFFSGETLKETDLSKLIISRSTDYADGYTNHTVSWSDLEKFVQKPNENWCNHHVVNSHRSEDDMVKGFNMIVLDIDDETEISQVQELLKDYTYLIHTTKRHQVPDENGKAIDRFRVILPTNYQLDVDKDDFREFMLNLQEWLPFNGLDTGTFQRSRKWACTENCQTFTNEGKLLDVLPFIPKTSRSEEFKKSQINLSNLTNLERWFANRMSVGSRNNELAKYGFMLLDAGYDPNTIGSVLMEFNAKLPDPLEESEILSTIMTSIKNKYGA